MPLLPATATRVNHQSQPHHPLTSSPHHNPTIYLSWTESWNGILVCPDCLQGGGAWSAPLSLICPIIHRPLVNGDPVDIEFEVSYQATADHLRSTSLSGGGCGGGVPTLQSALSTAQHWHTSAGDNAVANAAVFRLLGNQPQGAYSFHLHAASRAFNPAGSDGGFGADWNYDPVYNWVQPFLPVAVVNG